MLDSGASVFPNTRACKTRMKLNKGTEEDGKKKDLNKERSADGIAIARVNRLTGSLYIYIVPEPIYELPN